MITSPVHPGEILANKYRVERVLGQGGMGVVVGARHLELDQPVAIKFLVGDSPANAIERFIREAKAAALVKSEHVCRVYDVGRLDSGEPYIVMEYLEGTDLADKVEAEGPQPISEAVSWIIEACDALSSAHSQGIIHRDLKPANLFLQQNPEGGTQLKVVDFGISKLPTSGALTSTAVMMGSPYYMSPEQLESSRDVDQRSDVWSLGIVLYELLTGTPPFSGETLVQLAVKAREKEPDPPRLLRPEIPPGIEHVILRCLEKKAANRYPNVNEVVVDLAPFAPPEVASLVQKLSKRARSTSGRSSDPDIVLSKTVAGDPKAMADSSKKTRRDTPNSKGGPRLVLEHQQTLAPVLTDTARSGKRARLVLFGGIAGLALVTAGIFALGRRPAPPPAAILQEASQPPAVSIPAPPLPPTVVVTTSDSVSIAATSAALSATPPKHHAHSALSASASAHPSSTPPVASPAAPATTTQRPKRDLDRDYVP